MLCETYRRYFRPGKSLTALFSLAALFAFAAANGAEAQAPAPESCEPEGEIAYMCGLQNVEDLDQVPGRPLVLGASFGLAGGAQSIVVIDPEQRTAAPLTLTPARTRAATPYGDCPGPVDMTRFSPHGIAVREGRGGRHTLYVVNHSERESVEVFALDARRPQLSAQWIGCVILPEGASGNAVTPLSDGGFLVTKFYDTRISMQSRQQFLDGQRTSVIYRWNTRTGFSEIPGGEGISNNGVVTSPHEEWVYVTSWVDRTLTRLPLNGEGAPQTISFDFMPDNIRFDPDGALLVAGQIATIELIAACKRTRCPLDWAIARVDPNTLAVSYLYWDKGTPAFAGATTALQVGNEFWIGTFRGDRVAIAPVPAQPLQ